MRLTGFLFACGGFLCMAADETRPVADGNYVRAGFSTDPHRFQVAHHRKTLRSPVADERTRAAEALGFLRALDAAADLASALGDPEAEVRREAALALAWCGGRSELQELLAALADDDWSVRQSAWVALTNLTGMGFPYDALADGKIRHGQVAVWRDFLLSVPAEGAPREVLALLGAEPQKAAESPSLCVERGLRALGVFGGPNAAARIIVAIEAARLDKSGDERSKLLVQAGLRALGRLGDAASVEMLTSLLDDPYWARYAADALGDCGSDASAVALAEAYPSYARNMKGKDPANIPPDDRPGFESIDRAYETPFAIASALARMPLKSPEALAALRRNAPLLLANLAGDFDGAMLYEPEAYQLVAAWLLERAGIRAALRDLSLGVLEETSAAPAILEALTADEWQDLTRLAAGAAGGTSVAASWLPVVCRPGERVKSLTRLLEHANGWVRINAAKTLIFTGERTSAATIARLLGESQAEAESGYFGGFLFDARQQGQDEYNAPSPCWREAFTRALGELGGPEHVALLTRLVDDDRNVLEVRFAAVVALDRIGSPDALFVIRRTAVAHAFHSIRLQAREALWRRGLGWNQAQPPDAPAVNATPLPAAPRDDGLPAAIVFIKGDNLMPNNFQIDPWRQTYSTTDSGPTYRLGRNLHVLRPVAPDGKVAALTTFKDGYVADCEVSWDGRRIIFAHRGGDTDPWWHLFEIGADGTGLKQLTSGPYHDVQPAYLPDGRIIFSSSRTGLRDEYHGYPATGLTVMNPDGSDLHCIGFNLGRDNEPCMMPDGRIAFSRLELFYSRLKTELTVQAVFPDGTKNVTLYGPERREMWREVTKKSKEPWWGEAPPRHRVLRLTQPQPFDSERLLCASTGGPVLLGPGRLNETFIPLKDDMAVTGMVPLGGERILCSATRRSFKPAGVDLGIHLLNARTGKLTPLYNDPASADFEPRPLIARTAPPVLPEPPRSEEFTGRLLCSSARTSQEDLTRERGKLLRIIEGQPIPARHHTHTNSAGEAWKNHVGTTGRVLGTIPLAADGSFFIEVPADRLVHCQVLDSDRSVVGNQLTWIYARPAETRSCIGCHENPDSSPAPGQGFSASALVSPLRCLPTGGEFNYRAKAWQKGVLKSETENRTRTVQAINLLGR